MLGRIAIADHRRVSFGSAEDYLASDRGAVDAGARRPLLDEGRTCAGRTRARLHPCHRRHRRTTGTNCSGVAPCCSFLTDREWRFTKRTASTPPSPASRSCAPRRDAWKTRQAMRPSVTRRTSRPATGMRSRRYLADDILVDDRRRMVNAGIKRGRDAEIANLRAVADVGITYTAFSSSQPAGSASSSFAPRSAVAGRRDVQHGRAQRRRNRRRRPDRGDRDVRARRLRRRHRGARCPLPRRRSRRLRAHVVDDRGVLRRSQPAGVPDGKPRFCVR